MPQYAYRARNAQGGLVEGVPNCADRSMAIRQIEQQHCIPIKIDIVGGEPTVVSAAGAPNQPATQSLRIPHGQLLVFTEQLGHLLTAGMTLDEGLVDSRETVETTESAADDGRAAPRAGGWTEFLAGTA